MKNIFFLLLLLVWSFQLMAQQNASFKIIDNFEDGDGLPGSLNDLGYPISNYKSFIAVLNSEMIFEIENGRTDGSWTSNCGAKDYSIYGGVEIKARAATNTTMVIRMGKYNKTTINLSNTYQTFWLPWTNFDMNGTNIAFLSIGELSNASSAVTIDYISFGKKGADINDKPTTPTNLTSSNITTNTVTLNWTASTDNDGIQKYLVNIYRNGFGFDHSHVVISPLTSFTDTDLIPSNNYTIAVVAYDTKGNYSDAAWIDVTTKNIPTNSIMVDDFENGDGLPGSFNDLGFPIEKWKMNVQVVNGTLTLQNQVDTEGSWTTNCGGKNYSQYEGIELKAKSNINTNMVVRLGHYTTTTIALTSEYQTFWLPWSTFGIDGSTINAIVVGEFNLSSPYVTIDYISFGKKGIELNDIPTPPTNLVSSNVTSNGVSLQWTASNDNDGIQKYKINFYRVGYGFDHSHEVFGITSFTDTDLLPNNTYTIAVVAYDVKGNNSDPAWTEITTKATPQLISSHVIKDASNNGLVEYNEVIKLDVTISNISANNANGVIAKLTTLDPNVKISDSTENYDIILTETSKTKLNAFSVTIGKNVPDQHIVKLLLKMCDLNNNSSFDTISLLCNSPKFVITIKDFKDVNSTNNNGKIEPGESAQVLAEFKNIGHAKNSFYLWGHSSSSHESIIANTSTVGLNYIAPGDSSGQYFLFSVSPTTPIGTVGTMRIYTSNDLGFDAFNTEATFSFTVESLVDTQKPTKPENFTITNIATTRVDLSWTASTDNVGIDHYRINAYKNGIYETSMDASGSATSIQFNGLTPGTKYFFAIAAYDPSLNESEAAWSAEITTNTEVLSYKIVDDFDNGDGNPGGLNDLGLDVSSYKASASAYYGQLHFQMDYGRTDGSWTSNCGELNYSTFGGIEIKAKASANTKMVVRIGKYYQSTINITTAYQTIWIPWANFGTDGSKVDYVMIGEVSSPLEQITLDYISIGKRGLLVNDIPSTPEATYFDVTQTNVRLLWEESIDDDGIEKYVINIFKDGAGFDHTHNMPANTFTYTDTDLQPGTAYTIGIFACDVKGNCSDPKWLWITTRPVGTVTPIVSISVSPGTTITKGYPVTFTANTINAGTPTYQWYLNNNPVGTNAATYTSTSIANKDRLVVVITSSLPNAEPKEVGSNEIMMTVTSPDNYKLVDDFEGGDGLAGTYNDLGYFIEKWKAELNVSNGILGVKNEIGSTSGSWTTNCGGGNFSVTGGVEIKAKASINSSILVRIGQYNTTTINLTTSYQNFWLPWSVFNSTGNSVNAISIEAINPPNATVYVDQISFGKSVLSPMVRISSENITPTETSNFQAIEVYPNPANAICEIKFGLEQESLVNIELFDTFGNQMQTLVNNEFYDKGLYTKSLNCSDLTSGLYLVKWSNNSKCDFKKLLITK